MFLVFNKQKIISYIVAFSTVAVLFFSAGLFTSKNEAIQTSAKANKLLPIYSVDTNDNKVALTINCAWNADDIDRILDTLSKYDVKVTFFMVGDWVKKYPEAVKKIYEAGHEIGNHSDTHPHVNEMTLEKNMEQIQKCADKIEEITGTRTTLYRAPYGEYNDVVIKSAEAEKHIAIQWSLDTLDYTGLNANEMWERLNNKISNGSIILMHNGTEHTLEGLDFLIYKIQEKGYQIVTVSNLIYKDNFIIDSTGKQKLVNN